MLKFVIEEIPQVGAAGLATQPERFEWSAATQDAPIKPFKYPGKMRYKRTDYDGSEAPTFQIVGPQLGQFQFEGTWNDRYNQVDYAKQTKRRFLAMCYRGNPVRVTFDDVVLEGVVVDWDCPYVDDYRIRYSFTLDAGSDDMIGQQRVQRGQDAVLGGQQLADNVREQVDAISGASAAAPLSAIAGSLASDSASSVASVQSGMDGVDKVNEQLLVSTAESPTSLQRAAGAYRGVRDAAINVLEDLLTARSDVDMQYRTVTSELAFDEWRTTLSWYARRAAGTARDGERSSQERAAPKAQVTYRPHKNESLYAVSQAVYGTPHNARLIADRNGLRNFVLDGTETLVIPEAPAS